MYTEYIDKRYVQHELVNDYVCKLLIELGIDYHRNPFYYMGPDISGLVGIEIKSWDEFKKSYQNRRFWKSLIYNKILSKFCGRGGVVVNTLEIPVKWREHLRSCGVVPVYLDPRRSREYHKQLLLMAYLQALSLRSSLHCTSTRESIELNTLTREIDPSNEYQLQVILDLLTSFDQPFEVKYEEQLLRREVKV